MPTAPRCQASSSPTTAADDAKMENFFTNMGSSSCLRIQGAACPPGMQRRLWAPSDYDFHPARNVLHEGEFSTVVKAKCLVSGSTVVLKMYAKKRMHPVCLRQVEREIAIHSQLNHKNIVNLYGAFQDSEFYYLVLECANGGDLFEEIHSRGGHMSEKDTVNMVALPLLRALAYLHDQGFIHRDVKPENILFDSCMTLKLADFGFVVNQNEERPVTRAGTTQYMAPEIVHNPLKSLPCDNKDKMDLVYGEKVDIWSAAVTIYEALHGFPTFGRSDSRKIVNRILNAELRFFPDIIQLSEDAKDFLVAECFHKVPEGRGSAARLIQHRWIQQRSSARRSQRLLTHPSESYRPTPATNGTTEPRSEDTTTFALPRRHTRTGPSLRQLSSRNIFTDSNIGKPSDMSASVSGSNPDEKPRRLQLVSSLKRTSSLRQVSGHHSHTSSSYGGLQTEASQKGCDKTPPALIQHSSSRTCLDDGPASPTPTSAEASSRMMRLSRRKTEVPCRTESLVKSAVRGTETGPNDDGNQSLSSRVCDAKARRNCVTPAFNPPRMQDTRADAAGHSPHKGSRSVRYQEHNIGPGTEITSKDRWRGGQIFVPESSHGGMSSPIKDKRQLRRVMSHGTNLSTIDTAQQQQQHEACNKALLTKSMPSFPRGHRDVVDEIPSSSPPYSPRRSLRSFLNTAEMASRFEDDHDEENRVVSPMARQQLRHCGSKGPSHHVSSGSALTRPTLGDSWTPSFTLPQARW